MGAACHSPEQSAEPFEGIRADFRTAVLTEEFKACLVKQRPHLMPGAVSDLGVLAEMDAVLSTLVMGSETGNSSAHKNGSPYMRSNIFLAYLEHATLSLTDAERFLPPLLELCTSFAPSFSFVSSKIVVEPPGSSMPTLQAENDMIVIQLWGEQRLKICQSIQGLPVTARRPEPYMTPTLCPGDALFVPQHLEVRFEEPPPIQQGEKRPPTMYAVLSLRSSDQSLGVSLGKHLTDVLREAELSKETDCFLRSAVTKTTVPRRSPKAEMAEHKARLEANLKVAVSELSQKITASSLCDNLAKRMSELRKEQAEVAAKVALQIEDAGKDMVFDRSYVRISSGVICQCQRGDNKALFTRGSETLPLPIAESASYLIADLCDGKPHLVSSLSCTDPLERLCVCQVLILKKCLAVVGKDEKNLGVIKE